MLNFQNISLRRKQTLIIMLTSSVVLLLACAAFVTYDTVTFRGKLVESVSVLADVIGNNCAAAIDFNDPKVAGETLAALHANNNIVSACIYSRDGQVFAVYQRDPASMFVPPLRRARGYEFTGQQLHLFRPIQQQGERVGTIFVASDLNDLSARLMRYLNIVGMVFLASLLLGFVLSSQLQRLVSDPILHLARVARSVALEKNYSVRAAKRSNDELGQLVDGFNEMLAQIQTRDTALQTARDNLEERVRERTEELENIHKQLLEASRRSGMAEVATSVLHNVGNVLNSVNVASSCVADSLRKSKIADLSKIVALLQAHENDLGDFFTNDPKSKYVPLFLAQLTRHLIGEQAAVFQEIMELQKNIGHIKDIVKMQQGFAKASGVTEIVHVSELVEDALKMNLSGLVDHDIVVVKELTEMPPVTVEKHKVLQILVNLLRNAQHACEDSSQPQKKLTIRTSNNNGRIQIAVCDNGVGIPPENLTRIFSHGFTTKKDGHGFGLHSGALAAKEMGGALSVHSDGVGKGSEFSLELPLLPPQAEA